MSLSTDNLTVFDRQTTQNGSPIVKTFNLSYDSIQNATLYVQLLADPAFLGVYGWKLKQITVNGVVFYPSDPNNSTNLIMDISNTNPYFHKTLIPNGQNTISIDFSAPIGAGVISQNASINAQLSVTGSKNLAGNLGLNNLPSGSDILSQITTWIQSNTPTFIAILALIAIIIGAIAYSLGRVPRI